MYVILYEYRVDGDRQAFERVYRGDGEWASFFASAAGYRGTELLQSAGEPDRYVLADRWTSADAFEAFRAERAEEYDARSRRTSTLYRQEVLLGAFETVG